MANAFLKPLGVGDQVKNFTHATKLFVDDNYRLAPKQGFLFHVAFQFGSIATAISNNHKLDAGMLVKAVDLPRYSIDRKILSAYNRKNAIQSRINYNDVKMTFHDDTANVVLSLWDAYYKHYFKDTAPQHFTYRDGHKYQDRATQNWGFEPENDPFFSAIKIYSLSQKQFTEYTLINPIIQEFGHGRHDVSDHTRVMEHEMTVSYEVVKYRTGVTSADTVDGFATLHYDLAPSPLGDTIADVPSGPLTNRADLNDIAGSLARGIVPALLNGGNVGSILNQNIKGIAGSQIAALTNEVLSGTPLSQFHFPTINNQINKVVNDATQLVNSSIDDAFENTRNNPTQNTGSVSSNGAAIDQTAKPAQNVSNPAIDPNSVG